MFLLLLKRKYICIYNAFLNKSWSNTLVSKNVENIELHVKFSHKIHYAVVDGQLVFSMLYERLGQTERRMFLSIIF